MARFKWIEWNLDKVAAHGLTCEDVERAFENRYETVGTTVVFVITAF